MLNKEQEKMILSINDGYCETYCEAYPIACNADCSHISKKIELTKKEMIDIIAKALCSDDVMRQGFYELANNVYEALYKKIMLDKK